MKQHGIQQLSFQLRDPTIAKITKCGDEKEDTERDANGS